MTEAVILVPGIMGSVLKDGADVVWPGSPLELLFPYTRMAQLMKPTLQVTDIIRDVSIVSQYSALVDALGRCGFTEGNANPNYLKVFPYDWRKDNAIAAQGLADCVDEVLQKLGPGTEITLLVHSMGGLVSRYYLESGLYSARTGLANVRRLITMGTPHRGSPVALAAAVGLEKRLFLNAQQVKQLANDPKFPSLYQLLPPPGEPFSWDRGSANRYLPLDIYDPVLASSLGLSLQNLQSASALHAKLNLANRPAHVRYFCFVGTQQSTMSSVQITAGVTVDRVMREDAGDGTVPVWSALLPGVQMEPVGGEHGDIYKNSGLQHVLGPLLGKMGVLYAAGPMPEINVNPKVVEPAQSFKITVEFPRGTTEVDGAIRLTRSVNSSGQVQPAGGGLTFTLPIRYKGPPIDHLAVEYDAPNFAGIYEVSYATTLAAAPISNTELFVQEV